MTETATKMGTIDKAILKLDDGALGALSRVAIGFATLPAMWLLLGRDASDWVLVPFLLAILLLLRLAPAVMRRMLPVPTAAKDVWAQRRRLAKRYDSYQWRKLAWIGLGLILYIAVSGQFSSVRIAVGLACLLAGAAGMARWYAVCSNAAKLKTCNSGRLA